LSNERSDDALFSKYEKKESKEKPRLRLQLMSDLHIEFRESESTFDYEPIAPYLGLLGDIGVVCRPKYAQYIASAAQKYKTVFVIAGNHEFYGSSLDETKQAIAAICKEHQNVVFLDRTSVLVDGIRILGCTLWTATPPGQAQTLRSHVTDYRQIWVRDGEHKHKFTVEEKDAIHTADVKWLSEEIAKAKSSGETVVILTHHSPTLHETAAKCEKDLDDMGLHSTNLHWLMGPPVHTWAFGHVHWNSDQLFKGTRLVCNQRGYPSEPIFREEGYVKFAPDFVVEIE